MEIQSVSSQQYAGQTLEQGSIKAEQFSKAHQAMAAEQERLNHDKQVAREEVLDKIKNISEEGTYSVRFEKDEHLQELIVKVVDRKTDEVVRQLPPEEILGLKQYLSDLRGNLANSVE